MATVEATKRMGRPPGSSRGRLPARVVVPASDAYRAWLAGFADHLDTGMAGAVREALRQLAESSDYRPPPLR